MTAQIPDGSVVITPTQMYAEIRSANEKIDHLTAIVDPALQEMRTDIADVKASGDRVHTDHETRIRSLEHRVWRAAGMATLGASLIALAVEYIASH